jgi:predicted nucleotidyltransferase
MTPQQLTEQLRAACGSRLRSVVLYGSAAAGDYTGKRSNYNVLVVLDRIGLDELKALAPTTRTWVKAGNPPPLLFTHDRLRKSADVFPIEIADIKSSHETLFGENLLGDVPVHDENLRWQLESELKGALIALRERYLLTGGKPREVTELLIESLSTILVLFRAALRLYQSEVPSHKMDALAALTRHVPFDARPFETIAELKEGRKPAGVVPDELFVSYLQTTETVVDAVDDYLHGQGKGGAPS